ncbi:hypothetical protein GGI12_005462, partial [Dipsacomyces acuminosporus]
MYTDPCNLYFDGRNMSYPLWASKVRNVLRGKGCYDAASTELRQPNAKNVLQFSSADAVKDGKAAAIIQDFMSDTLASKFVDSTAHEMWTGIESMFNIRTTNVLISELRDLLTTSMDPHENPVEYWVSTGNKWSNFPHLELDLKTVSPLVRLAGLSQDFSSVRDKFAHVEPEDLAEEAILQAIKEAYTLLQEAKLRSKPTIAATVAAAPAFLMCQLCDAPGHAAKECPTIPRGHAMPTTSSSKGPPRRVQFGGLALIRPQPSMQAHSRHADMPMVPLPTRRTCIADLFDDNDDDDDDDDDSSADLLDAPADQEDMADAQDQLCADASADSPFADTPSACAVLGNAEPTTGEFRNTLPVEVHTAETQLAC